MKIRVKFEKTGILRYIGHLDMMRYFQKAVRRSGIAASYSNGFSPHMIMSFAEPLGVGTTSVGEYFDMELDYADPLAEDPAQDEKKDGPACPSSEELVRLLNAEMADGVKIVSVVRIAPGRKGNAMSVVARASYTVSFPLRGYEGDLGEACRLFMKEERIEAEKKTKSGVKLADIRPLIVSVSPGIVPEEYSDSCTHAIDVYCASGSEANLKMDVLSRAFFAHAGFTVDPLDVHVLRNELYAREGEDYLPLSALGKEIP